MHTSYIYLLVVLQRKRIAAMQQKDNCNVNMCVSAQGNPNLVIPSELWGKFQ